MEKITYPTIEGFRKVRKNLQSLLENHVLDEDSQLLILQTLIEFVRLAPAQSAFSSHEDYERVCRRTFEHGQKLTPDG